MFREQSLQLASTARQKRNNECLMVLLRIMFAHDGFVILIY